MRRTFPASSACSSTHLSDDVGPSQPDQSQPSRIGAKIRNDGLSHAAVSHGLAIDNRDRVVIFRSRLPLPVADLTSPPVRSLLVLYAGVLCEAQADCIKVTICSRVQKSPDHVRCTFEHCFGLLSTYEPFLS